MHNELQGLIDRLRADSSPNWVVYRQEIVDLSPKLRDEADRVAILSVYKVLMDTVEPSVLVTDLPAFQKARLQDYRLLLVEEAADGGELDPRKLDYITKREVDAGRLAPDDDLRELGQIGATFLAPAPTLRKGGWFRRLMGQSPK